MTPTGPVRLHDAWKRLTASVGADEAAASSVWSELDARYTETHRAYHTWSHIDHVHQVMEWILTRVVAARPAIEFAVFFHDAVYRTGRTDAGGARGASASADPGEADNETASAALARAACGLMAVPDRLVDATAELVVSTRHHVGRTPEEAVLCDADLAILASPPATYDVYRRAIRVEYGHVGEATFRQGRSAILRGLLRREFIYSTPLMRDRGESAARENLKRELADLA